MPKEDQDQALLEEARKRFKQCEEAEDGLRQEALDDLKFRAGEQWPDKVRRIREESSPPRPCLTINVLPSRERQILNDQRQNRPSIHVNAVDDKGDEDTAEVLQGIIRHIEYDSNADVAYDTGFAAAVRGGFGFWRVVTEPESPLDFDEKQVIKIKRIRNAFSVYMDPAAVEPDKSDATFAFIFTKLKPEAYKEKYGKSQVAASLDDLEAIGDRAPGWLEKDGIRIAEYFLKTTREVTLCKYADGSVEIKGEEQDRRTDEPVAERQATIPSVEWRTINGIEVLNKTEWAGQWIPIIPVLGDELEVDGKLIYEGMVRHTKDPMRMSNYMASAQVETITQPNPPWIAPAGSIEQYKKQWDQAGTGRVTVLPYDPIAVGNTVAPPPTRNTAEPAIVAISQARAQFVDDLKAVTGIYDAQLGARSNEQSGRAINSRKEQGQIANFHYIDNLTRAIRHTGRILLDLIPKIYDTPRVLRIIGEDGSQKTVKVNQQFDQGGVQKIYDLTVGRYDVTVSAGPSYQTKRQEQADSMIDLTKASPIFMQACPDLIVQELDFSGHREMAERMKRFVMMQMPGLIEDEEQDIPPQAQALIAQKTQEAQAMHEYAKAVEAELGKLQQEKQAKIVETQGRMEIEKLHSETQLALAEINTKAQNERERMKLELDLNAKLAVQANDAQLKRELQAGQQTHEAGIKAADAGHESGMADKTHQQAIEQSEVGHQQTLEQQDQAGKQALVQQEQAAKLAPKPEKKKNG